jgi:hypothetical protein
MSKTKRNRGLKKTKSRKFRGGFFGKVIETAVVPFALLGMKHLLAKTRQNKKKHHKHHK